MEEEVEIADSHGVFASVRGGAAARWRVGVLADNCATAPQRALPEWKNPKVGAGDTAAAARRVIKKIRDGVDILMEHPGIGRAGRLEGTRGLVIRQYPHIVAYRMVDSAVHVLAVVHTSRLWPEQLP